MKFVKENLTLVICGAVVLLVLIFLFVPMPGMLPWFYANLTAKMQERYDVLATLQKDANTKLNLPGVPPQTGIPSQSWVDARKGMIKRINDEQTQLAARVVELNRQGRVDRDGAPLFPDASGGTGTRMSGVLPQVQEVGKDNAFKGLYNQEFGLWTGYLASGSWTAMDYAQTTPPVAQDLTDEWNKQQAALAAQIPGGAAMAGGFGGTQTVEQKKKEIDFYKGRIMSRATGIRMYIEPTAFQRRASWADSNYPPKPEDIFAAFIDLWLQSDLVHAISQTNDAAFAKDSLAPKNVGRAAVKRLVRVVVGSNAAIRFLNPATPGQGGMQPAPTGQAGDPGTLFYRGNGGTPGTVGSGGSVTGSSVEGSDRGQASTNPTGVFLPTTENVTDYTQSMTGRTTGKTYDVVYMSVVLDIDPAYLFTFIDKFYAQNSSYTLVNMQEHTVDPMERVSNGYLYGASQVAEYELLVECPFYRDWTKNLMPDAIKTSLGGSNTPPPQ